MKIHLSQAGCVLLKLLKMLNITKVSLWCQKGNKFVKKKTPSKSLALPLKNLYGSLRINIRRGVYFKLDMPYRGSSCKVFASYSEMNEKYEENNYFFTSLWKIYLRTRYLFSPNVSIKFGCLRHIVVFPNTTVLESSWFSLFFVSNQNAWNLYV